MQDNGGKCFTNETIYKESMVFAFITVMDIPDLDPQFIDLPYTAAVEENSVIVSLVLIVIASLHI